VMTNANKSPGNHSASPQAPDNPNLHPKKETPGRLRCGTPQPILIQPYSPEIRRVS